MSKKDASELRIWRLASFRISTEAERPELFCLILEADKDQPLSKGGRILFFREIDDAELILEQYAIEQSADKKDLDEPFFICDIASALYVLTQTEMDDNASVLGAINTLLDLVAATSLSPPTEVEKLMKEAADYFTFNKSIAVLFSGDPQKKEGLVNAILWYIGAVCVMSEIVSPIHGSM